MDARDLPSLPRSAGVALAGCLLLLVAAFLPWSVEPGGPSYTGFDHGDGYVTFGAFVVVVAVVLWRRWSPGARVATALVAIVPVYLFVKWFRAIRAEAVSAPGLGLYLTLFGGLLLLAGAAYSVVEQPETATNRAAGAEQPGSEPSDGSADDVR